MRNVPYDVTIISGDGQEIRSNKNILSLFCPTLRYLLPTSSIRLPKLKLLLVICVRDLLLDEFWAVPAINRGPCVIAALHQVLVEASLAIGEAVPPDFPIFEVRLGALFRHRALYACPARLPPAGGGIPFRKKKNKQTKTVLA